MKPPNVLFSIGLFGLTQHGLMLNKIYELCMHVSPKAYLHIVAKNNKKMKEMISRAFVYLFALLTRLEMNPKCYLVFAALCISIVHL
jgi:hypothetical protein